MMENNKFKYKIENKRYHTWNYYLRDKFGTKVFKVSINAGFTCPNIDGSISYGGCAYCSKDGSGDFAGNPRDNLVKQFKDIKEMMEKKPEEVVAHAVSGMLPKNKLRDRMMTRLRVYRGAEHPHAAQNPQVLNV